ncbi:MAG: hypothetical protein ABI760_24595 [Ferruginibacter sp.]
MLKSLTDISPDEFEEIKKLAALFYTPRDIAIILEIDIALFVEGCFEEGSPTWQYFNAGRLLSETELRAAIMKLAKAGSSPAQTMATQMLMNSKMKMLDR